MVIIGLSLIRETFYFFARLPISQETSYLRILHGSHFVTRWRPLLENILLSHPLSKECKTLFSFFLCVACSKKSPRFWTLNRSHFVSRWRPGLHYLSGGHTKYSFPFSNRFRIFFVTVHTRTTYIHRHKVKIQFRVKKICFLKFCKTMALFPKCAQNVFFC